MVTWYRHLIETMKVKSHIFWHSSAALNTGNLARDLSDSAAGLLAVEVIDCAQLPLLDSNDLDASRIALVKCDLLVLVNFDKLLNISHGRIWMRQLRPAVVTLLQQGTRLIVASGRPQSDFPAIDGSSLATDCTQYICPPLAPGVLEGEISLDIAIQAVERSAGLRRIVSDLLAE